MRERWIRKHIAAPDLIRPHSTELLPCRALQFCSRPDGYRLAARHFCLRIEFGLEVIPALQQLALNLHDSGLVRCQLLPNRIRVLVGPISVEGIPIEIESRDLSCPWLAAEGRRG